MAMSGNTPIGGGPSFQGYTRQTGASGQPAEGGAQFHTDDAVTLGSPKGKPEVTGSANFSREGLTTNYEQPLGLPTQAPSASNVPTVLTVGDLGSTSCDHPDLSLNGLGRSYIETMGTRQDLSRANGQQVIAGQKPLEN